MEYWQSNAWVNYRKYTYIYDVNGNSIAGKLEAWQNNNWSSFAAELSVYSSTNVNYSVFAARYEAHFVSFTNGINENSIKNNLSLFPNPATNSLTLNLSQLKMLQNTSVSVYDIQGKLLLHQSITQPLTELNITQFAKGIYIVKVNSDSEILQSKFIKD